MTEHGGDNAVKQYPRLSLARGTPFDPTPHIGSKSYRVIPWHIDGRIALYDEIDFSKVLFETCLKPEDQGAGRGGVKLRRLEASRNILLDARVMMALWNEDGYATLEWIYKWYHDPTSTEFHIDFFGTVIEAGGGKRYAPSIYRSRWGWFQDCRWLELEFDKNDIVPVLVPHIKLVSKR